MAAPVSERATYSLAVSADKAAAKSVVPEEAVIPVIQADSADQGAHRLRAEQAERVETDPDFHRAFQVIRGKDWSRRRRRIESFIRWRRWWRRRRRLLRRRWRRLGYVGDKWHRQRRWRWRRFFLHRKECDAREESAGRRMTGNGKIVLTW